MEHCIGRGADRVLTLGLRLSETEGIPPFRIGPLESTRFATSSEIRVRRNGSAAIFARTPKGF